MHEAHREWYERKLALALFDVSNHQDTIDRLILATPSGERRNLLTDLNLHLMAAIDILKKVI